MQTLLIYVIDFESCNFTKLIALLPFHSLEDCHICNYFYALNSFNSSFFRSSNFYLFFLFYCKAGEVQEVLNRNNENIFLSSLGEYGESI